MAVAEAVSQKFSEDQVAAVNKFNDWLLSGRQEFRLGGMAGTGKTTLIKAMRTMMGSCHVVTPTAKAAEVLQQKKVPAQTIHSLY